MPDPTKIIERKAQTLYRAFCTARRHRRHGGGAHPLWSALENWQREIWRQKALADIRSEETVADELKREDAERRRVLSEREVNDG